MLSDIVGTGVPDGPNYRLLPYGIIADRYLRQLSDFYSNIKIDRYVIMPNHIHILLENKSTENGPSGTPVPTNPHQFETAKSFINTIQNSTTSRFIGTFKRFCNKEYGHNIWQYRSYDHIIRDRDDYFKHLRYSVQNPAKWYYDKLYSDESVSYRQNNIFKSTKTDILLKMDIGLCVFSQAPK